MAGSLPHYPKREPFFANRLIRLLITSCAAQDIGAAGVWLVSVVAQTEDSKRYAGPVAFFNEQLLPMLGVKDLKTFAALREKVVSAGWLKYLPASQGSRLPGRYWSVIPKGLSSVEDSEFAVGFIDGVTQGENPPVNPPASPPVNWVPSSPASPPVMAEVVYSTQGENPPMNPPTSWCHSPPANLPIPIPNTKTPYNPPPGDGVSVSQVPESERVKKVSRRERARSEMTEAERVKVDSLYQAYPMHTHRREAEGAILKVLRSGVEMQVLMPAVQEFARRVREKPEVDWAGVPHPGTFFNGLRWQDDPETWSTVGRRGPVYEARLKKWKDSKTKAEVNNHASNGSGSKRGSYTAQKTASGGGSGKPETDSAGTSGPVQGGGSQ